MLETPEHRLAFHGWKLPALAKPAGNLLGFRIDQGLIFVSGQLPLEEGRPRYIGKIDVTISPQDGIEAARLAALNVLAQLSQATGSHLSRVGAINQVMGFVNCAPDYTEISRIVDGASDVFVSVLGERGRHARVAIGVASLPRGVPVEIAVIARLAERD